MQTVTDNSQTSDSYEPILFNESVKKIYKTVSNSSVSVQIPVGRKHPYAIFGLNFIKFACPLLNISYLWNLFKLHIKWMINVCNISQQNQTTWIIHKRLDNTLQ